MVVVVCVNDVTSTGCYVLTSCYTLLHPATHCYTLARKTDTDTRITSSRAYQLGGHRNRCLAAMITSEAWSEGRFLASCKATALQLCLWRCELNPVRWEHIRKMYIKETTQIKCVCILSLNVVYRYIHTLYFF